MSPKIFPSPGPISFGCRSLIQSRRRMVMTKARVQKPFPDLCIYHLKQRHSCIYLLIHQYSRLVYLLGCQPITISYQLRNVGGSTETYQRCTRPPTFFSRPLYFPHPNCGAGARTNYRIVGWVLDFDQGLLAGHRTILCLCTLMSLVRIDIEELSHGQASSFKGHVGYLLR